MSEHRSDRSAQRISRRIAAIAPSATLAVDSKAKELKAAGEPVIGFGAGEPDFPTPAYIVDAAAEALKDPSNFRYSPGVGLPALREAIAAATARDSGWEVDPSQIIVTNGGKQAVYQSFQTVVDDGDEVLLPSPYWTTYPEAIRLAGGTPVEVFAGPELGYKVTPEMLEEHRTDGTKALLLCSPSNPTGAVFTAEEIKALGAWAAEKGLMVITDEIYQHLVYDGLQFTSIAGACPELGENVIVLNGVAKTYAMTGWRVGWMIGPKDVIKAAGNLQSHLSSNVNNIAQRAAIAALTGPMDEVEAMKAAFDRRRKTIVEGLNAIDGVEVPTPQGAFYAYADVRSLLGRNFGGTVPQTSAELAELVLNQAKVAVVPGEAFGPSGYFRLSYALGDDDLAEGLRRLQEFLGSAT
ncbi:pyridoxal phosphate-dependent aminotransferase [Kocuria sp. JC486]|uniref:pyridoxal phosphate-dependent aminotransferase n=1 Tax=Kocuria sp. JC486 TaxID=1970736 RepID=UPI0014228248|nr:pyridoxal phosphate-dependent aminotransferase [Kocuria sp. JC486]NHU84729.1 pyridoxal phosphate-dependent aminotransferase [Kocuria sp. JC486]